MTGNKLLETTVGTVSPSGLSTLNVSKQVCSPAAKLVGVVHGVKSLATSLVGASNHLKVAADAGNCNPAVRAAGTSTKGEHVDAGEPGSPAGQQGGLCGATLAGVASPMRSSVPVSAELGLAMGACKQPPAAPMQVVGPHVAGFVGVCAQPPMASLQVAAPHAAGHVGVG